jgi:hypothetical protein
LSACRKRRSLIQRRRSTSSVCMSAICPAGPPKLMKPSLSQKRSAWPRLTACGAGRVELGRGAALARLDDVAQVMPNNAPQPLLIEPVSKKVFKLPD